MKDINTAILDLLPGDQVWIETYSQLNSRIMYIIVIMTKKDRTLTELQIWNILPLFD